MSNISQSCQQSFYCPFICLRKTQMIYYSIWKSWSSSWCFLSFFVQINGSIVRSAVAWYLDNRQPYLLGEMHLGTPSQAVLWCIGHLGVCGADQRSGYQTLPMHCSTGAYCPWPRGVGVGGAYPECDCVWSCALKHFLPLTVHLATVNGFSLSRSFSPTHFFFLAGLFSR